MKNGLSWLLAILMLSACSDNLPKETVFKGKLENAPENYGLISSKGLNDTITINSDGTFRFTKQLSSPSYFTFRFGRSLHTIYLIPGDSLSVELNLQQRSNDPVYAESLAPINNYILKASKVSREVTSNFRELFSIPIDAFTHKLDSAKNEIEKIMVSEGIENTEFIAFEKERLNYQNLNLLFYYPNYNARLTGKTFSPDSADYSFMNGVDLSIEENLHINEYASLVTDYVQHLSSIDVGKPENKGKSNFEKHLMFFDLIDSLVTSQEIREYIKHQRVIETIQWENLEEAKSLYEHFMREAVNESYIGMVSAAYKLRIMLAPGTEAPAFSLTGIDGNTYNLSDFRGKLVYIDFWASWCAPCRAEIPSLLKLKEEYKNKPIAFVAISLDDDVEAWKNMVEEKGLKGYQLHAEKAWSSDVAKKYQIKGVPTFVLIDADGKFIEYNVARPSNPEINLIFDKHLKTIQ